MRARAAAMGAVVLAGVAACSSDDATGPGAKGTTGGTTTTFGEPHSGSYHLGPVAWAGSFHNSCAPYTDDLQKVEGDFLAGLGLSFNGDGSLCDACIQITTAKGKSVVARVVTTGETNGPNDVDLSQAAWDAIHQGEYPRSMTWKLGKCPSTGAIHYQFQTAANPYWTSLWVRNGRMPIARVDVKSEKHPDFAPLVRGGDGTLTDEGGFGDGPFTLRVTSTDGQTITDTFPSFTAGGVLVSSSQFQ